MKIEYFREDETENYILRIPFIKWTDDRDHVTYFIDCNAFIGLSNFTSYYKGLRDDLSILNNAINLQFDEKFRDLIICAISIVPYEPSNILTGSTPEKDIIWRKLIDLGIVFEKYKHKDK